MFFESNPAWQWDDEEASELPGRRLGGAFFVPAEAYSGRCTAKSTIFTANIAAGLMFEQFSRHLRRLPIDHDVQLTLLSMELTVKDINTIV